MLCSRKHIVYALLAFMMVIHKVANTGFASNIHQDSSKLFIDFETNHSCPATFTRWQNDKIFNVISVFLEYTTIKYVNKIGDLLTTMRHLFKGIEAQSLCSNMDEYPVLTTVCHTMNFHSWIPSAHQWQIHVYKSFMINITIEAAYVPYNTKCKLHNISVYSSHTVNESQAIGYFCGKISNEPVYTKYNKALLTINFSTAMTVNGVFITARYTTHIKGSAYKFLKPCLSIDIRAPSPNIAFFFEQRLSYIWYLSNEVIYRQFQDISNQGDYGTSMLIWTVQIHSLICDEQSAEVQVYPGLLPFRWFMWMIKPYYNVPCNTTQGPALNLDFQRYITVRLHVIPMAKTFLNMTLQYNTTYANLTHYGKHYTLLTHEQYGRSSLRIERLTYIESLTIKRLTYDEPTTTIQPDLVHGGSHEVNQTRYQRLIT